MTDRIDFGGKPWKAIPRDTLRDPRLTLKAHGALTILLSHDEGWVRSCIAVLMHEARCGRDAAQSAMGELRQTGYAELVMEQDPDTGQIRKHYVIYAEPRRSGADSSGDPGDGKPIGWETRTTETQVIVEEPLDVEPLEEEPSNNQKLAPTPSTRPPDLIFEALFGLETGKIYNPSTAKILTPSARAALNKAVAEVKATGVDVADLMRAISAWPAVMGDATCTANAVAKHLPRLLAAAEGNVARAAQPSEEQKVLAELARRREEKEAMGG